MLLEHPHSWITDAFVILRGNSMRLIENIHHRPRWSILYTMLKIELQETYMDVLENTLTQAPNKDPGNLSLILIQPLVVSTNTAPPI